MPKVTLEEIEGVDSITITTDDGKTLHLRRGQPAVIADQDKRLLAAVQHFPIDLADEDEDDDA